MISKQNQLYLFLLFVAISMSIRLIVVASKSGSGPSISDSSTTVVRGIGRDGRPTRNTRGETTTKKASPCDSFYDHVCDGDEKESAFATMTKKNEATVRNIARSTSFYENCVEFMDEDDDGGGEKNEEGKEKESKGLSPLRRRWPSFDDAVIEQASNGRKLPFVVNVVKALHLPRYVMDVDADYEVYERAMDDLDGSSREDERLRSTFVKLYGPLFLKDASDDEGGANRGSMEDYIDGYRLSDDLDLESDDDTKDGRGLDFPRWNGIFRKILQESSTKTVEYDKVMLHLNGKEDFLKRLNDLKEEEWISLFVYLDEKMTYDVLFDRSHPAVEGGEVSRPRDGRPGSLSWYESLSSSPNSKTFFDPRRKTKEKTAIETKIKIDVEDRCLSLTRTVLMPFVNRMFYLQRSPLGDDERGEERRLGVERLCEDTREAVASVVNSSWVREETKRAVSKKLRELQFYVLKPSLPVETKERKKYESTRSSSSSCRRGERDRPCFDRVKDREGWISHVDEWLKERKKIDVDLLNVDFEKDKIHLYEDSFLKVPFETVNAWYDPTRNSITVPPGILVSPFYEGDVKESVVAKVGAVLAHETGHSLDNHGIFFDELGCWRKEGLWDGRDEFKMNKKMKCLAKDYGHPCKNEMYGMHTMGEDMADQMGVRASFQVWKGSYDSVSSSTERKFFENYADLWCSHLTRKRRCELVYNDVHALSRHRVDKTLRQLKEFSDLFECKKESNMVNPNRCTIY